MLASAIGISEIVTTASLAKEAGGLLSLSYSVAQYRFGSLMESVCESAMQFFLCDIKNLIIIY